jgi:uncharacterized membrane protein HdeD (DUF308 family)
MSDNVAPTPFGRPPLGVTLRESAREVTGRWWMVLVAGIAWLTVSLIILQFDQASITTVSAIVGVLFLFAAAENFALAGVRSDRRWVSALFGVLFVVAAVACFVDPTSTFAGLADMLGFLFLLVGVWWMVRAFLQRPLNPFWWIGLIAGVLMTGMAFWTAGQFFIEKTYVLLAFAGIWALMEGITDIVQAFEIRRLREQLGDGVRPQDDRETTHPA